MSEQGSKKRARKPKAAAETAERYRVHVAYVGEDGIKQGVRYRLNDEGEFVEASE
ncbi:hypothetical protein [Coralloluteibacterium thermophilus]|uniref:Uncharacterized protein n=1 Tax=Coralloluteibacterium thermophilum TaxID=2707049 RepID=A0ABV9NR48_9GAMM